MLFGTIPGDLLELSTDSIEGRYLVCLFYHISDYWFVE